MSNPETTGALPGDLTVTPQTEQFSFCVGRPWPKGPSNPDGTSISVYAHGVQVLHGTMEYAKSFRAYVDQRTGEENFIYMLVPVSPQS